MLRECFFNGNLAAYIEWVVVCVCVCVRACVCALASKWCCYLLHT